MHPGEHAAMARVEDEHWWYRGLRDALVRALERDGLTPPRDASILDAGCGTGANLRLLADRYTPSYLGGFDLSQEALVLARDKAPEADIYAGDICAPELRAERYDLVVSMDVVYIPGVERAFDGLRQIVERLRPGGVLVLNLPAYDWLYSEHDAAIHTSERYTRRRVADLLARLGLRPVVLTYRLCLLFPAVVATRVPGMLKARRDPESARSDLHEMPSPLMSKLCLGAVRWENGRIRRGWRFPFGSSVFAVARREAA